MVEAVVGDVEVRVLLGKLRRYQLLAEEQELAEPVCTEEWYPLPKAVQRHIAFSQIAETLNEIEERLRRIGYEEHGDLRGGYGKSYVRAPARKIVRGFLEPIYVSPIVRDVSTLTLAMLTKVEGLKDQVWLERHGPIGWHYHYCDRDGRRSDTILSWDTHYTKQKKIRPLFWERHSEKNSKFQAKAALWGEKKRQSIYDTCQGDLKRAIAEFRHPSTKQVPSGQQELDLRRAHPGRRSHR